MLHTGWIEEVQELVSKILTDEKMLLCLLQEIGFAGRLVESPGFHLWRVKSMTESSSKTFPRGASHSNTQSLSYPYPPQPSHGFHLYKIVHFDFLVCLFICGLGLSTALIASSKTLFKFRCVSAEHSKYLCALISFATIKAWS